MDFPIRKAQQVEDYPAILRQALTKPFKAVYQNIQAYIVEYESVQDVLDEQPDMNLLKALGKRTAITTTAMDVAITSKADDQYDCVFVILHLSQALMKTRLLVQFIPQ